MSTPPFLRLPGCARALRVTTARGEFAALWAEPAEPSEPVRGTALLVPGFTGSKEDFIALLEPLAAAGYRVLAVDQRGQYETGGPADPAAYAIDELARDVLALTEWLAERPAAHGTDGGTAPLHLLGHSFGGQVVREAVLAAAATGRPLPWRSLTLLATGPGAIDPAEATRTKLLVDALESMDLESIWQVMQQMEEGSGSRPDELHPEVAEFLHRRWLANVPVCLRTAGAHLISAPDRVAELSEVDLPKLVLSGVRDYAWPVELQSTMAELLAARRVVVEDAGHSPNAEQPAATAAALVDFWA
ncbi:alpha/beta fold hydrolase [Kitasatospora camelliae]|uniref:Alpha/beta fold hydrolase n=1 Tax=Kitasatospora camelliae TaxID=3156397 RepID=A0AAU8K1C9_9ACTN